MELLIVLVAIAVQVLYWAVVLGLRWRGVDSPDADQVAARASVRLAAFLAEHR